MLGPLKWDTCDSCIPLSGYVGSDLPHTLQSSAHSTCQAACSQTGVHFATAKRSSIQAHTRQSLRVHVGYLHLMSIASQMD